MGIHKGCQANRDRKTLVGRIWHVPMSRTFRRKQCCLMLRWGSLSSTFGLVGGGCFGFEISLYVYFFYIFLSFYFSFYVFLIMFCGIMNVECEELGLLFSLFFLPFLGENIGVVDDSQYKIGKIFENAFLLKWRLAF